MKLNGKYTYSDSFDIKYINGVIGGIDPHGEIAMNFYYEKRMNPLNYTLDIAENHSVLSESNVFDEHDSLVRCLESGVIMSLPVARSIHEWLGNLIDEANQIEGIRGILK